MVFSSKKPLKFSKFLKSRWLTDVKDHMIKKPNIVVNISNTDAIISGPEPRKVLPPRKSTILQGNNADILHWLSMVVVCYRWKLNFWLLMQAVRLY